MPGLPVEPRRILREIEDLTTRLVEIGLADDQNAAYVDSPRGADVISVRYSSGGLPHTASLKHRPYRELYWEQRGARAFNFLMLDGALVQMTYEFLRGQLTRHRLAFLPSPDLSQFQNEPELYLEEILYADVCDLRVVAVPLRFDYDAREGVGDDGDHPTSHLTLGQYHRCRIPVSAGLTPHAFVQFLLRSFYGTAVSSLRMDFPAPTHRFDRCLAPRHEEQIYVGVPTTL